MVTSIKRKKSILVCYTFGVRTKKEMLHVHVYFFFASDGKNNNKINNKNNTSTSNEMETERQERNNDTGRQPITQSRTGTI